MVQIRKFSRTEQFWANCQETKSGNHYKVLPAISFCISPLWMNNCDTLWLCVCVVVWKSSFKAMGSAGAEALIYLCVSQHISGTRGPDTTDRQKWIHQIRAVMIIMCFKGGGGYNLALRPSLPRFYQVVRVATILQCISQWITPVCSW